MQSNTQPLSFDNTFTGAMGLEVLRCEDGQSDCRLVTGEQHRNVRGMVHGGVTFALIDSGMGSAVSSTLREGEGGATIEIKITYMAPVYPGTELRCASRVIKRGKTVIFIESEVTVDGGAPVARATGTYAVTGRAG